MPKAKVDPELLLVTVTEVSTLSSADTLDNNFVSSGAAPSAEVASIVRLATVNVGAVWSVTFTVADAEPPFPAASVEVNVTFVSPSGNVSGALLVAATEPSTASEALAEFRNEVMLASVAAVPLASVAAK